ncbi:aspartate--tRNA(Asn) ligase [Kitasatospora sp. NPDC059088]|uniref:aspartate--tRNA(Asn) ligase n=1 Tax=Kitasatospora sp. NPDC059088 TaxID=3346722 RepID=UPI0036D0FCE3
MIRSTNRVLTAELRNHVGQTVEVSGWLHRRRDLKNVTFLILRDRAGLAQVVTSPTGSERYTEESVVTVRGTATANTHAPGGVEITSPEIRVLSAPVAPPPFDLYRPTVQAGLPTILDNADVTLRHPLLNAPHRLSAASVAGFRETLSRLGFTEIHTPKVVSSATESGANVFAIDWFGREAYLAQSPQFFKQAMVGVFERVFETGPVFRAEPHDTARHLAQYTSLDAELGFITDHRDVMAVVREVVAGMAAAAANGAGEAAELLEVKFPEVPDEIPEVHFAEAMRMLGADEPDLSPAHERWLSEWALREYGSEFLFVTGYPMVKRPFYTHPQPDRPEYSNSFDLLFRGLELVTGGQRLHRYEDYTAALEQRGEPLEPYQSYLSAFAHGMPPHGGFALGLERWTTRLTGADNVRRATLFPRDLHRLTP